MKTLTNNNSKVKNNSNIRHAYKNPPSKVTAKHLYEVNSQALLTTSYSS